VRERAGQLAQAKAEYQAYLRRYPQGAGADRVRQRLQALAAASIAPRTFESGAAPAGGWTMAGSAALGYQYDKGQTVSAGTTTSTTGANAALVYGDLLVRDRGSRYDFTAAWTQATRTIRQTHPAAARTGPRRVRRTDRRSWV